MEVARGQDTHQPKKPTPERRAVALNRRQATAAIEKRTTPLNASHARDRTRGLMQNSGGRIKAAAMACSGRYLPE
jgi:hypothetical protein